MTSPTLKKQSTGLLIGLVIQYLLGMGASLFVQFPENESERQLWEFAKQQTLVAAHIAVGFFLVLGSLTLLIRAVKAKDKKWITASAVGFIGILVAAFAGSRFIPTQMDAYSYIMAVGFLLAVFSYGWGMYQSREQV